MAKIDVYLKTVARLGATGMTLQSDANIVLNFSTGDRHAVQKTSHADLAHMLEEVAPPEAHTALYMEHPADFGYEYDGVMYAVAATTENGRLTVVITEGAGDEPAPQPAVPDPAPAPAPSPPPEVPSDQDFGSLLEHNTVSIGATEGGLELGDPGATSDRPEPDPPPLTRSAPGPAPLAAESEAPRTPDPTMPATGLVDKLLRQMNKHGASDLHLSTGSPPYLRLHGEMKAVNMQGVLSADALYAELHTIMPAKNREEFARRNDTDFAYEIKGLSRYRVNIFRDRHGPGAVIRSIPFDILTPEQLGLPREVLRLCYLNKGLVLVTGPTGSGKSTTLATLVDFINQNRTDHIITIEDPIEFVHDNKRCLVNQREVHEHTDSFKDALRAALREDPDIVLVGEMRDLETIAIAVETAETGHLVFGTLHTTTAPSTVDRIIDQFPADRQDQIRQMLAESLRGVIAQNLCRRVGGGRVAAYEILIANKAVANIIRERKTYQLPSLMQTGRAHGMRTLSDSLIELVRQGVVEPMEAYLKSVDKTEFHKLLVREGHPIQVEGEDAPPDA